MKHIRTFEELTYSKNNPLEYDTNVTKERLEDMILDGEVPFLSFKTDVKATNDDIEMLLNNRDRLIIIVDDLQKSKLSPSIINKCEVLRFNFDNIETPILNKLSFGKLV